MIGGEHQHERVITMAGCHLQRCRSNRGGGVAAKGFKDETVGKVFVPDAGNLAVLVLGLEEEFAVGNGQGLGHIRQRHAAQPGFLQQTLSVRQANERLGMQLAGNRPESGTCSAAQNRRDQFHKVIVIMLMV